MLDVEGLADLQRETSWLADVLGSRGFPLEHLPCNLELAANVINERLTQTGES